MKRMPMMVMSLLQDGSASRSMQSGVAPRSALADASCDRCRGECATQLATKLERIEHPRSLEGGHHEGGTMRAP